ncbi:cytochrome P450 [Pholiota conissans]|uniref:Cytochrome P450 n=1 Tax=Pholiota conissans TaxID=109636 RepID=A0A9P6CYA8_9AGAR|nr:cytochrome P450 [Pholiota conissans]
MAIAISSVVWTLSLAGAGAIFLWVLNRAIRTPWRRLPYPPGPPPKGIISGNKDDVSIPWLWRACSEWANTYGNILYFRVSGKPFVVLNSLKDATELLEKRSHNYSSRPITPMYNLMGFTNGTALRPYSPEWRRHRRILQQTFKPESALAYRPTQTDKMHDALYALLTSPKDFEDHIKTYAGAIILSVTYGYDVAPKDDRLVFLLEGTRPAFSLGQSPKWLVNTFPFLGYIPSWVPGAGFQKYAAKMRKVILDQRESPFKYARDKLASGSSRVSVISKFIESCHSEKDVTLLKEVAATGYAGVGTTTSTIMNFFIAMISFPEVQKKAQEEIDRVIGSDRLPNYNDMESLPYVTAVLRETIRWKPLIPLGLPHASKEDDIYQGYFIPKDSTIHINVWAMTRDSEKYKDPEVFNPDRFFDENGELNSDDVGYAFGFGRRICPGRHLGSASVWLAMATILSTFDIGKNKDSLGKELPLDVKYTERGLISYPLPFECSITPRSDKVKDLILEARGSEA